MEAITTGVSGIIGLGTTILGEIMSNTTLAIIVAGGFAGLGLKVLRKVIKTSKVVG